MVKLIKYNIFPSYFEKFHKSRLLGYYVMLLIFSSIIPNRLLVLGTTSLDISPNNHAYPIYNVLNMKLNNATNGELWASLKFYNASSNTWEINTKFLNCVEEDLKRLCETTPHLVNLTIYSTNDTLLPGTIYLLLTTEGYKIASNVTSSILPIMHSWWYVENVSYPTLDLYELDPDHPGDFRWLGITSETGNGFISIVTGFLHCKSDNFTLDYNQSEYTRIYQTDNIDYFVRTHDGIIASPWLWNGSQWNSNVDFVNIIRKDVSLLNNSLQDIMQIDNISLSLQFTDVDKIQQRNESSIISPLYDLMSIVYRIIFDSSLSRTEQLHLYFLIYALLSNYWYTEQVVEWYICGSNTSLSSFQFVIFIFGFVPFVPVYFAIGSRRKLTNKSIINN